MTHAILVVDNSEYARSDLTEPLKAAGFVMLEAANGLEALQILERQRIDLVITDIHMPVMTGIELCEAISASALTPKPAMIVVSAESHAAARGRAKKAGVYGWMLKPVSPTGILRAVRDILSRA